MDLEATFPVVSAKPERLKDSVLTLFDDDFSVSTKVVKDWILESSEALESYFLRPSKKEEIIRKKLGFINGVRYLATILLSELTADQGRSLEDTILEELTPLIANYCADCQQKIEAS
jgi:hypothetical protein|tara:strand:- start:387 stop:737 length:351 start_codon:yes stop_codon:yes gene_type:complete